VIVGKILEKDPRRRVPALIFGPDFIHWRRSGESWPRVWPGRGCSFAELAGGGAAAPRWGSRHCRQGTHRRVRALIFWPDFIHWRRS
jgi:hypothetical protein